MQQRRKLKTEKERLSQHHHRRRLSFCGCFANFKNNLSTPITPVRFIHIIFVNDLVSEASSIRMITFAPGSIEHLSIVLNFIA